MSYDRQTVVSHAMKAFWAARIEGRCAWCGGPVTGRRRTWCSGKCRTLGYAHFDAGSFAGYILIRDSNVCQWPGCHAPDPHEVYRLIERRLKKYRLKRLPRAMRYAIASNVRAAQRKWSDEYGSEYRKIRREVHHIHQVHQGGTYFDTRNALTLCHEHHVKAHRQLRRVAKGELFETTVLKARRHRICPRRNSKAPKE